MNNTKEKLLAKGHIDGIKDGHLRGWFFMERDDTSPAELVLFINNERAGVSTTIIPRNDVFQVFDAGRLSGFCFELGELSHDHCYSLRVMHEETGYDFDCVEVMYCPAVTALTLEISALFQPEYYRYRYKLENLSNDEALQHFLTTGIYHHLDPCPWFCHIFYIKTNPNWKESGAVPLVSYISAENGGNVQPSEMFEPVFYRSENPDLADMSNLLGHFVSYGHREGRAAVHRTLPTKIHAELEALTEFEPTLSTATHGLNRIVRYPNLRASTFLPRIISRRFSNTIKAVICVPFISRGGADLLATILLRAYQNVYGKNAVLLIITDQGNLEMSSWLDDDSQYFCLDNESTFVSKDEKISTLHNIIGLLAPEQLFNVNSNVAWDLIRTYGKQLSSALKLYTYIFCFDYDADGRRVGYIPGYVPETINYMTCIFCDNATIIDEIRTVYGFSDSQMKKFHNIYTPASDHLPTRLSTLENRGEAVLWMGRFSRQKRPELLVEIAQNMPNLSFEVYGTNGDSKIGNDIIDGKYPNIKYLGFFNSFSDIDFNRYSLLLNTSKWEGIPTILIQTMKVGLPIVTSIAGGINELVSKDTGWLVEEKDLLDGFIKNINRVLIQKSEASRRVALGKKLVHERHNWEVFYSSLADAGVFFTNTKSDTPKLIHLQDTEHAHNQPDLPRIQSVSCITNA